MKILSKYVLKEHIGPLTFALTALTSLLLLNYIAKQFGNLVGKGLPWSVIGEFFLLSIPFTVAMTLPMAVLVSTLYAFSRLASENEITALKASGVGMPRILFPVLVGAAGLSLLMVGFNDQVLPRANHRLRVLTGDIARTKPTFALREQVITELSPGKLFIRANHIDEETSRLREVTIYDLSEPARWRTIHADSGLMEMTRDQRDLIMTLFDGYMQELPSDQPGQLQRLFYRIDRIRVRHVGSTLNRSLSDNEKGEREKSICEMQRSFDDARRGFVQARLDLAQMLGDAAHQAATGERRPPRTYAPRPVPDSLIGIGGIGGAYCAMMARLGVAEAHAAPPPPASTATPQDVPGRPDALGRLRGEVRAAPPPRVRDEAALPAPPSPSPAPAAGAEPSHPGTPLSSIAGLLEASQSRIADNRDTMNRYEVEIQKKFAIAVACVVFVLLGAPIALRFPRGGVGLVISVSLGVFALYYVGLIAGEALADRGHLTPFWAMWAANVLFTLVGLVLLARMGKESSTARGGDMGEMWDSLRAWAARQGRRVGLPLDRRHHAS